MKTRSNDDGRLPDDALPPNTRPECIAANASLQRLLDGDAPGEPDNVLHHRRVCASCRSYADGAHRLVKGLQAAKAETLPPDLAERVLMRLRAEPARISRRLSRYAAAALALAACVALAVVAVNRSLDRGDRPVAVAPLGSVELAAVPAPLSESIDEAASAVSSLTRKTRDDALSVKLPTLTLRSSGPLERLEPAVASIEHFGQDAVLSVAPITNSAKRAADLLWREVGPDSQPRRDMN
jgi:hypothetical protein